MSLSGSRRDQEKSSVLLCFLRIYDDDDLGPAQEHAGHSAVREKLLNKMNRLQDPVEKRSDTAIAKLERVPGTDMIFLLWSPLLLDSSALKGEVHRSSTCPYKCSLIRRRNCQASVSPTSKSSIVYKLNSIVKNLFNIIIFR